MAFKDPISSRYSEYRGSAVALTRTWLKDPFEPRNNVRLPMETKWMKRHKQNRKSLYHPLGREKPIVIGDRGRYVEFELTFVTLNDEMYEKVERLIDLSRMLLVQTPKGSWYCEVFGTPDIDENQFNFESETHRKVTIPFLETRDYDLAQDPNVPASSLVYVQPTDAGYPATYRLTY